MEARGNPEPRTLCPLPAGRRWPRRGCRRGTGRPSRAAGRNRPESRRFCGPSGVVPPRRSSVPRGRNPRLFRASLSCFRAASPAGPFLGRRPLHLFPSGDEPPGVVLRPTQPLQQRRLLLGQLVAEMLQGQCGLAAGVFEVRLVGRAVDRLGRRGRVGLACPARRRPSDCPHRPPPAPATACRSAWPPWPGCFSGVPGALDLSWPVGLRPWPSRPAGLPLAVSPLPPWAAAFSFGAGGLLRGGLVAGLVADLAFALFVGLRAAFVGGRVRAGAADAGLIGLLAAPLLAAAGAVAGRVALGVGLFLADAGRLGLLRPSFGPARAPASPGFFGRG